MIHHPNLPEKRITHCLIGEKYLEEIAELKALGITPIPLKGNPFLQDEIRCHADILAFNPGNGTILINKGSKGESELQKLGYEVIEIPDIRSPYPYEVALNAALIKDKLICKKIAVNPLITEHCYKENIKVINTNQGYSKCNLCIVSENAIITEDAALAYLLNNYQFNVLKLEPGFVGLSYEHYGFIGGASAKLSEYEIYFSGDLSSHPQYDLIIRFLNKCNVMPVFNKNRPLRDFGGIIQL